MFNSRFFTNLRIAAILFCWMSLPGHSEERNFCIRDIEFTGNKAFTARQLHNVLSTVPYLESALKTRAEQEQATCLTDLLKKAYCRTGFFDATISPTWDKGKSAERRLRVAIVESVPYQLNDVLIRGLDDNQLKKEILAAIQISLRRVQKWNTVWLKDPPAASSESAPLLTSMARAFVLEEGKDCIRYAINDALRQSGFAEADYILSEELNAEKHEQVLIVTFASIGPTIRVEQIRVSGLERNTESEFLSYVDCAPGMEWTKTKCLDCERKLNESGRFQRHSLGVSFSPIDPSLCIVSFHIVECPAMPRLSEKLSEDQETLQKMAIQLSVQSKQNLKATLQYRDPLNIGNEPKKQITFVFGKNGFAALSDCAGELDFLLDADDNEANIWCDGTRVFSTDYGMLWEGKRPQVNMGLTLTGASVAGEKSNLEFGFKKESGFSEFAERRIVLPPFYFLKQKLLEIIRTPETIRVIGEDFSIVQDTKNGQIVSLELVKSKDDSSISFHFEFGQDYYSEIHKSTLSESYASGGNEVKHVSQESISGSILALFLVADIANHSDLGKSGEGEFAHLAFASRCGFAGFGENSPQVNYLDELYGYKHKFASEIGAYTAPILKDQSMGPISCSLLAGLQLRIGYSDSRTLVQTGMERCNPKSILWEMEQILANDPKMKELLLALTGVLRKHPHWLRHELLQPYLGGFGNELAILLAQDKSTAVILKKAMQSLCENVLVDAIKTSLVASYLSPIDLSQISTKDEPTKDAKKDTDKEKKTGKVQKEPYKVKLDGLRFTMPGVKN